MAVTYAYANVGGSGNRVTDGSPNAGDVKRLLVTTTATISSGAVTNLGDGDTTTNSAAASVKFNTQTASGLEIKFNFSQLGHRVIQAFKWYQQDSTSQGTWKFQGSNNGSSWTDLLTGIALGGATTTEYIVGNTAVYLFYRLLGDSGSLSSTPWVYEVEFKISGDPRENADRTAAGATQVAVTTSMTLGGGSQPFTRLVNGGKTNDNTGSCFWTAQAVSGKNVKFDFTAGTRPRITGFTWWQQTTDSNGVWDFQGSNDNSIWTTLLASLTLQSSTTAATQKIYTHFDVTNPDTYAYYRLNGVSGNSSATPWLQEVEFDIEEAVASLVAGPVLGITEAATLTRILSPAAVSASLGISEAAVLQRARELVASHGLGISEAITLTLISGRRQPVFFVQG